jgi:hypothetical protein
VVGSLGFEPQTSGDVTRKSPLFLSNREDTTILFY